MKVPKYIKTILKMRRIYAEKMNKKDAALISWMKSKGMDLTNSDITDSILGGAMMVVEPYNAEKAVLEYIQKF